MADRPIIFSGPMVRALLAGTKTQTRRVLSRSWSVGYGSWLGKSFDEAWSGFRFDEAVANNEAGDPRLAVPWCHPNDEPMSSSECGVYRVRPPYAVGDRLWVRETWNTESCCDGLVAYRADGEAPPHVKCVWRPPRFMPRWASRLTLVVTDVRVQRLQEITNADAIAEGFRPYANSATIDCATPDPRDDFRAVWTSIHGPDAWAENPWVAAITFTVHRCNIDRMERDHG